MQNWKIMIVFAAVAAAVGGGAHYFTKNMWITLAAFAAVGALSAWGAIYLPGKFPALAGTPAMPPATPPAA